jgi:imidazolonepropionase-like amidohydrolase
VVPGSGNIVGGKSAVIRNFAAGTSDALVARAGIKGAFGYNPMSTREWKGSRPWTRMGALALLRSRLAAVRQKLEKRRRLPLKKRADVEFTAEEEVLRALLERREVFRVHVHKADDIDALLRLAGEFRLRVTCEHTMDIFEGRVYEELARRDVPVIYGPLDSFAYKVELRHEDPRNVRLLVESGVRFGLMTDHPVILQSTLLLCLRWFLRAGLSPAEAIGIVTRRNAEILGVADRLGTLERGRWASLVCWDGDPFELASQPALVLGEGRPVHPAGR